MSDDKVHVIQGGDIVVACTSREMADIQYTVMVGANLDTKRWVITHESGRLFCPSFGQWTHDQRSPT